MSNIAVIPVSHSSLLRTRLAGRTCLEHLLEKLKEIRELNEIVFFAPSKLHQGIENPTGLPWRVVHHDTYSGPMLQLREKLSHEGHLQDNYLFCNPWYPLVGAGRIMQALLDLVQRQGMMTVTRHHVYSRNSAAGTLRFAGVACDVCTAVRGSVAVQREDLWYVGDSVGYIPLTDIEAISVASDEGLRLVQALVLSGEL